jgi:hypothetical protein
MEQAKLLDAIEKMTYEEVASLKAELEKTRSESRSLAEEVARREAIL